MFAPLAVALDTFVLVFIIMILIVIISYFTGYAIPLDKAVAFGIVGYGSYMYLY